MQGGFLACTDLQTLSGQDDQTNVAKHQVGELREHSMCKHVIIQASRGRDAWHDEEQGCSTCQLTMERTCRIQTG